MGPDGVSHRTHIIKTHQTLSSEQILSRQFGRRDTVSIHRDHKILHAKPDLLTLPTALTVNLARQQEIRSVYPLNFP